MHSCVDVRVPNDPYDIVEFAEAQEDACQERKLVPLVPRMIPYVKLFSQTANDEDDLGVEKDE